MEVEKAEATEVEMAGREHRTGRQYTDGRSPPSESCRTQSLPA